MFVVKVPGINGLGKTAGARDVGNDLIAELRKREVFDLRVEEIHVNNDDLVGQEKLIFENALEAFLGEERVLFLGGDHSVSYSLGRAFVNVYGEKSRRSKKLAPARVHPTVDGNNKEKRPGECARVSLNGDVDGVCFVVFDAHADCMPSMQEPTHEEWLRALIERCGVNGERVLLIGAREVEPAEEEFMKKVGIRRLDVSEVRRDLRGAVDRVREFVGDRACYVSFDVDVLDESLIQATGYPVEGGLELKEAKLLVRGLAGLERVKGFDVVELHADKESFEKDLKRIGELLREIVK
jgi:arginase